MELSTQVMCSLDITSVVFHVDHRASPLGSWASPISIACHGHGSFDERQEAQSRFPRRLTQTVGSGDGAAAGGCNAGKAVDSGQGADRHDNEGERGALTYGAAEPGGAWGPST